MFLALLRKFFKEFFVFLRYSEDKGVDLVWLSQKIAQKTLKSPIIGINKKKDVDGTMSVYRQSERATDVDHRWKVAYVTGADKPSHESCRDERRRSPR